MIAYKTFAECPPEQRPPGIDLNIPWQQQRILKSEAQVFSAKGWTVIEESSDIQTVIVQSIPQTEVVTQFEKNDKDLKLSSICVPVDSITGRAILTIPAMSDRYLAGGEGFFTKDEPIRAISVNVIAATTIPANSLFQGQPEFPPGTPLKAYHDDELDSSMQGWRLPSNLDGSPVGIIEIETLAGYGKVPAGLGLQITMQMPGSAPFSGYFSINIEWGRAG